MERSVAILISASILVTFFLLLPATAATEENRSTSAANKPFLSSVAATMKERGEEDLLSWLGDEEQIDGGFSSLDGMLQWAVGHSDPEKLKEAAEGIKNLSPEELEVRQMELKEVIKNSELPSDAKLMKVAIDDLNNPSLSLEDRYHALEELLILVEPIDNANDLHKLGGLTATIKELNNPNVKIRCISAWILGIASQNNHLVQKQILELEALAKLVEMAHSNLTEEASKALYAISALIRNNRDGQDIFFKNRGDSMLQNIIGNSSIDTRLLRKSILLLTDLIKYQLDFDHKAEPAIFSNHVFLKSVVFLIESQDLDVQENALHAVKNLLLLRSTKAVIFREVCELDLVLWRVKQQLKQLILHDDIREYILEIEALRKEVELIFRAKIDEAQRNAYNSGSQLLGVA